MYIAQFDLYLMLALAFIAGSATVTVAVLHYIFIKDVSTNARHKRVRHTMNTSVDLKYIEEAIAS